MRRHRMQSRTRQLRRQGRQSAGARAAHDQPRKRRSTLGGCCDRLAQLRPLRGGRGGRGGGGGGTCDAQRMQRGKRRCEGVEQPRAYRRRVAALGQRAQAAHRQQEHTRRQTTVAACRCGDAVAAAAQGAAPRGVCGSGRHATEERPQSGEARRRRRPRREERAAIGVGRRGESAPLRLELSAQLRGGMLRRQQTRRHRIPKVREDHLRRPCPQLDCRGQRVGERRRGVRARRPRATERRRRVACPDARRRAAPPVRLQHLDVARVRRPLGTRALVCRDPTARCGVEPPPRTLLRLLVALARSRRGSSRVRHIRRIRRIAHCRHRLVKHSSLRRLRRRHARCVQHAPHQLRRVVGLRVMAVTRLRLGHCRC